MANIDLSKYGITGATEIVYNPSYEDLYKEETNPALEGYEKGQESELGAVNVMTGIYTGRSPKDKYIVMDENSKDTVWWTSDEYKNDNHPASQEAWKAVKELAVKELSNKRLFVVDAFCGANHDTRMAVRFIVEVAWQAHFIKNMFIQPTAEELENFEPNFIVYNASKAKVENYKELDMVQQLAPIFENLKGNFSGSINVLTDLDAAMSPVLETMQGDGSLSTRDLSLSGVKAIDQIADAISQPSLKEMKVKDMTLDFTIKDGRVETKPFDIKMGDYNLNLSGSTGLDQTIDYSGKIKLPASTGISKLMTLDLKIGGSFTSPKVSVDTKSMANQALESVADEAISKLGEKLGLDSATTANKDSIKQKVTEKATEKALDFLKKKLK